MLSLELLVRTAEKDASHAPDMTKKEYDSQQKVEETAATWERIFTFFQLIDFYCSLLGTFLIIHHDLKLKFS